MENKSNQSGFKKKVDDPVCMQPVVNVFTPWVD